MVGQEVTEHIAAYLRANGFEGAVSGSMPPAPDRVAAVYATGVRPRCDRDGSRFQVIVRGLPGTDTAIADAMAVSELLDDFEGITAPDSPYFIRIRLDAGAAAIGADERGRLRYSLNFTAWWCE